MDVSARFERMVREHQHRIFVFALGMCGSRGDAEDATQETFLRAYRAMAGWDAVRLAELRESAFLHRICLNVCRNRARRVRVFHELPDEVPGGTGVEGLAEREELMAALGSLPVPQRSAVVLRHVGGWSTAETAALMAVPENTVKSHLARGLAALRRRLDQEVA
ncbi:MAG TPA: RNA polymerase sigma factor [Candidatus Dormibacteraeota bacterium]